MYNGLYLTGGQAGTVVAGNTISNIRTTWAFASGIWLQGDANGVVVQGNVVKDCGVAFFTANAGSGSVVNNLSLVNNIVVVNSPDVTSMFGGWGFRLEGQHNDCRVDGNTFSVRLSSGVNVLALAINDAGTYTANANTFLLDGQSAASSPMFCGVYVPALYGAGTDVVISDNVFRMINQAATGFTAGIYVPSGRANSFRNVQCIGNVFRGATVPAYNVAIYPSGGNTINSKLVNNIADGGYTQRDGWYVDAATIPNVAINSDREFTISQAGPTSARQQLACVLGKLISIRRSRSLFG
jgi:hypothetical protein